MTQIARSSRHYVISGRVQGVGYRRFAEREALRAGVSGAARNLRDGRVEILARGEALRLEKFETALSRGPSGSSVSQIEKQDLTGELALEISQILESDFGVLRDGEKTWL